MAGFELVLGFYAFKNPNAEHVTYAFGMWLYKCSFWGRSLITLDFADDQSLIFTIA